MTQAELNTLVVNTLTEVIPHLPDGGLRDMAYNTLWAVLTNAPMESVVVHSSKLPLMEEVKRDA